MKCWQCDATLPDPEFGKLTFRAECEKCGAALHCCRNCKYYHPGKPNDCEVPGTDYIADRAKANVCEEFRLRIPAQPTSQPNVQDIESRLFGDFPPTDAPKTSPKDKFNSLFKDD